MTSKDWAKVNADHVEGLIAHGFMTEEEHYNDWVEDQAAWHDQEAMQDIEDERRYPFFRHF
jgi:hypothetical protein